MSLFDVLRYPLSDIPTEEQIANLPSGIQLSLRNYLSPAGHLATPNGLAKLFQIYNKQPRTKAIANDVVRKIRKEIAEYESI